MTNIRDTQGEADPIARAVAKLARAFPLDGEHFRNLDAKPAHQAEVHQLGAWVPQFTEVDSGIPGVQTFKGRLPADGPVRIQADRTRRYAVEFMATGARVEFVILAGQSFTVDSKGSDLIITVDGVEAPDGGLQLVQQAP